MEAFRANQENGAAWICVAGTPNTANGCLSAGQRLGTTDEFICTESNGSGY